MVNEIIFLGYFILGLDFFVNIVPDLVLNCLYLVCYITRFIENIVIPFIIYFKNKVKKIKKLKKKKHLGLKNFVFEEGLKIILNPNSAYFRRIETRNRMKKRKLNKKEAKRLYKLKKQKTKKTNMIKEIKTKKIFR